MSTLSLVLIVAANITKLVIAEAPADSKISRVGLIVKDLGLLDKATLAQVRRSLWAAQVKYNYSKSC